MSMPSNSRFLTRSVADEAKFAWPEAMLSAAAKFVE
jgi:hypothetical protein